MTNDRQHNTLSKAAAPSNRLRKMGTWLAFVSAIVLIQLYFTTFRNSIFMKNTLQGKYISFRTYKDRQHLKSEPTLHILLVAYARTGSSFLGDIIQSLPNSFYHFEPIHFIRGNFLNDSFQEARDLLGNLFVCNISQIEGFLSWQMKNKVYMKLQRNTRYWEHCSRRNICYDGAYIDDFCLNQSTVIAKTIRINLLEASKLFTTHPHLNLKIIYLTRDPRGTMNSRMKEPVKLWCKHDQLCTNSTYFCDIISDDVTTACSLLENRPEDFMVIRYEDISTKPYEVASRLAKFLGLTSVPYQIREFIKTHTYFTGNIRRRSKATGLGYAYTTFRNSSITAMSWRKEMTFRNISFLQKTCRRFISAFGYHSYKTLATLRTNTDMNTDLQTAVQNTCNITHS